MTAEELTASSADLAGETKDGMWRQLWLRLGLEPYGDSLRTPGAAFWIFCARVAIFVMAIAEALSWSYLGYYVGQSSVPYLTAAMAGLAIFSVIWIIDASFITLDTSRSADEVAILGRSPSAGADRWKLGAGLLIRVAIISATLVISAPFLAQLVFFRDISAEMNRRDASLIAERRAELERSFEARDAGVLQARRDLDAASIREAAGAGPSGRLGRGPAVATIEKRIEDVDRDLTNLRLEKEAALRTYDGLDKAGLQQRYGLRFAEDGIRHRGEILAALRSNETYADAELAIRGFLAFLFLALIVLKLFQPASVSVYYSELLQDLHAQYRAGSFDSWLPPGERSYARVGLTPLRFKAWCSETYRNIRTEEEHQRRLSRMLSVRGGREMELRTLRRNAEVEAEPLRQEAAVASEVMSELQDSIGQLTAELRGLHERLVSHDTSLASLDATLQSGIADEAFVRAAESRAAVERDAAQLRASIRAREVELEHLTRQADRRQRTLDILRDRLAARETLVRTIDSDLAQLASETSATLSEPATG